MNKLIKEAYHKKLRENIKEVGFQCTYVYCDDSPSFCYSIGIFQNFNIPEVFISSLPQNLAIELIHSYVQLFKENKSVPINSRINNLSERFPVYFVEVENEKLKDYVLSSISYYGRTEYKYLQLIYPDTKGNFPNEMGYNYDQEIMGNF